VIGAGETFLLNSLVAITATDMLKYFELVAALRMVQFDTWELFCKIMATRQVIKVTVICRLKQRGKFPRFFRVVHARGTQ
jgi:hypothetical protein